VTWQGEQGPPGVLDEEARLAAAGCLRVSAWMARIGMESAWRFQGGDGKVFALARVQLDGGGIRAEVGFAAEDLAVAAEDPDAVAELARQAVAEWRRLSLVEPPREP
jgi:hypothetical protein